MSNKKIYLSHVASMKMKYYSEHADGEISGLASSHINEDGDVVVEDAIIFKQVCTGASTDIDDDELAKFLYELHKAGEDTKKWNIWWHSHADMSTFWSATDDRTIEDHMGLQSYLISIVTNKKDEYKARIDVFPKDTSPFNVSSHAKEALDVYILPNADMESGVLDEIANLNKIMIEADAVMKEATERKEELSKALFENEEISTACWGEVLEKVTEKKYSKQLSLGNGRFGISKKGRGSYYGKEDVSAKTQEEFDKILDEINPDEHPREFNDPPFYTDDLCTHCYQEMQDCYCGANDGFQSFQAINEITGKMHKRFSNK